MNIKRSAWLSFFLVVVCLSVADSAHAAWPTTEANRCWGLYDGSGTRLPGSLVLHIAPVGSKASVVTGRYTTAEFGAIPVSGLAAIEVDTVGVFAQLGGYAPKPADSAYWSFNRTTLEMGNAMKPVRCRSLSQ